MRFLPNSLVIHRWVIESSDYAALKPISEAADGQTLHLTRREMIQSLLTRWSRMLKKEKCSSQGHLGVPF